MEAVHHVVVVGSIDLVVVNNTVDYEEAVEEVEVDDRNWMVDKNVEVVVGIEKEGVHLDDENLDVEYLEDVVETDDVERVEDDLHMDIAAVDYQSDETDADAVVAVDYDY